MWPAQDLGTVRRCRSSRRPAFLRCRQGDLDDTLDDRTGRPGQEQWRGARRPTRGEAEAGAVQPALDVPASTSPSEDATCPWLHSSNRACTFQRSGPGRAERSVAAGRAATTGLIQDHCAPQVAKLREVSGGQTLLRREQLKRRPVPGRLWGPADLTVGTCGSTVEPSPDERDQERHPAAGAQRGSHLPRCSPKANKRIAACHHENLRHYLTGKERLRRIAPPRSTDPAVAAPGAMAEPDAQTRHVGKRPPGGGVAPRD